MLESLYRTDSEYQASDASGHHFSSAIASGRAPSSKSASKLTKNELNLLKSMLKCAIVPTDHDKTVFADLRELGLEYDWSQDAELPQTNGCISHIKRHLQLPHGIDLIVANNSPSATESWAVEYHVYGMDWRVKGSNDALFVPTEGLCQPVELAFIGVKLKEALSPSDLDEGLAQYLTWGLHSYSAYIQIFTDLRSGGVAWWFDPKQIVPGLQLIRRQFFAGMPALYDFLNGALAAVPAKMVGFDSNGRHIDGITALVSEEFQQPRRRKLEDPGLHEPEAARDIMRRLVAGMDDDDAADPDVSLADWFPDGGDEPVKFPDEPSLQPCPSDAS